MTYRKTKTKLKEQKTEMQDQMLKMWQGGITMELLALKYGFTDRRAVWYHIQQARKRQ